VGNEYITDRLQITNKVLKFNFSKLHSVQYEYLTEQKVSKSLVLLTGYQRTELWFVTTEAKKGNIRRRTGYEGPKGE
jgi:hypothetical protein